jgi:hypothetical protein
MIAVSFDTEADRAMRSTKAVAMIGSIHGINCPFAIKSGQVAVENAGIQVSCVLYTKHSVEKRILIQVIALIGLGCLVLSKSPTESGRWRSLGELALAPVNPAAYVARTESCHADSPVREDSSPATRS